MNHDPNPVEQAVSRALRENLERLQRATDELNQAVGDIVSACASTKPTNTLPPMLRAQTMAAGLAATLDVLSRFVATSLQTAPRSPLEAEMARIVSTISIEPAAKQHETKPYQQPEISAPVSDVHSAVEAPLAHVSAPSSEPPVQHFAESQQQVPQPVESFPAEPDSSSDFDVHRLSPEEQELHRRANRVAKVSMQDIKMLHPEQVRQGRENKDLCIRLRDDIEKAHREYDRRFRPIMDHPVDYFYRWMVEILAEGDPHALGEYPYVTTAKHR